MSHEQANRESAERYGWTLEDFAATSWEQLEEAVRAWQGERFLPVTGVVDLSTVRALVAWRTAQEVERQARSKRRRREEGAE